METITVIYLILMFLALYMFAFFIMLTLRNRKELFSYPKANKIYNISVLIPAHNEEDSIEQTIEHIIELDYPKNHMEVIVINDGSTDKTLEVIKRLKEKHSNLKILDKKVNSGKADSLNQGIAIAKGELIAVVDSDSFPSKESLKKLTGYFDNEKMGAVTSFVTVRNKDENFFAKIQSIEYVIMGWARKILDFVDSVYVTNGPLSLYRKEYILEVGGFDRNTVTEDIDITWNMMAHDYKTAMCLDAKVSTIVPHEFKKWFRQRTRWGLGGLQAIAKYKKMFFRKGMFGAFVLPFVSLSIIISIIAFLFSSYILLKEALTKILVTGYSISSDSPIFMLQDINLHPPVLLFYMIILFSCSIIYYNFILYETEYEEKLTLKRFFNMVFYILIYLAIYPVVWFASIYRFARRDVRW